MQKNKTKTIIIQPNNITNSYYDFDNVEMQVFLHILYKLKDITDKRINRELFLISDDVVIEIAYMDVAERHMYNKVDGAIKSLVSTIIEYPSPDRVNYTSYQGFIKKFEKPNTNYRAMYITLDKAIVELLTSFKFNSHKNLVQFTSYEYETIKKLKNVYSQKMFILISAWKTKPSFTVSVEKLRLLLGTTSVVSKKNLYPNFKDFRKRIINETIDNINEISDYKIDFVINTELKEAESLTFILAKKDTINEAANRRAQSLLDYYYRIEDYIPLLETDIIEIVSITYKMESYDLVAQLTRILDIMEKIEKTEKIKNRKAYLIKSLKNANEKINKARVKPDIDTWSIGFFNLVKAKNINAN